MSKQETKAEPATQGVPRETPARNCLNSLAKAVEPVIGKAATRKLLERIAANGYFDLGLIDQSRLIVSELVAAGKPGEMTAALFNSPVDKIRSFGVRVHYEDFKEDIAKELHSLRYSAALPGTWTQETSQIVLKDMVHLHGLKLILPFVKDWVNDTDPTVRRVVIEALRPRGVWCKHITALKQDPRAIKPLLKKLLDDESDYVRKAVANSLNDISKDNPDLLCEWIDEWSKREISRERQWIIQRALRSLIKTHHPGAMRLMGLDANGAIDLKWKTGTPLTVEINQSIPFSFEATNTSSKPVKARIQLEMIGPSKSGRARVSKYLLANLSLDAHASLSFSKAITFAHKNFVPKLAGNYTLHVQCNGKSIGTRTIAYHGKDLK